jgi:hypothetical protein
MRPEHYGSLTLKKAEPYYNPIGSGLLTSEELEPYYNPIGLDLRQKTLLLATLAYNEIGDSWPKYNEIKPYLFLGRVPRSTNDIPPNTKLIVSVITYGELAEIGFPYEEFKNQKIRHLFVHMPDFSNIVSKQAVINAINLMHEFITCNQVVYVHCKAGRARSGMVVACYLAHHENIILDIAIQRIKEKRGHLDIGTDKMITALQILDRLRVSTRDINKQFQDDQINGTKEYLSSLQAKNIICQFYSFKILANYKAGLDDNNQRFHHLNKIYMSIFSSTPNTCYWYLRNIENSPMKRFLDADPVFVYGDKERREQMITNFLKDIDDLLKNPLSPAL